MAVLAGSLRDRHHRRPMERFLLRRLHLRELPQALLTFGFLFIFSDLTILIWGGNPQTMPIARDVQSVGAIWRVLCIRLIACHHRGSGSPRLHCLVDPGRYARGCDRCAPASDDEEGCFAPWGITYRCSSLWCLRWALF